MKVAGHNGKRQVIKAQQRHQLPASGPSDNLGALGPCVKVPALALVLLAVRDPRAAYLLYRVTRREDFAQPWARRLIERLTFDYYRGRRAAAEDAA